MDAVQEAIQAWEQIAKTNGETLVLMVKSGSHHPVQVAFIAGRLLNACAEEKDLRLRYHLMDKEAMTRIEEQMALAKQHMPVGMTPEASLSAVQPPQ